METGLQQDFLPPERSTRYRRRAIRGAMERTVPLLFPSQTILSPYRKLMRCGKKRYPPFRRQAERKQTGLPMHNLYYIAIFWRWLGWAAGVAFSGFSRKIAAARIPVRDRGGRRPSYLILGGSLKPSTLLGPNCHPTRSSILKTAMVTQYTRVFLYPPQSLRPARCGSAARSADSRPRGPHRPRSRFRTRVAQPEHIGGIGEHPSISRSSHVSFNYFPFRSIIPLLRDEEYPAACPAFYNSFI